MTSSEPDSDDFIARLRTAWSRALPTVDTSPVEVLGRIQRVGSQATRQLEDILAPAGVSRSEFDVLCALARSDRPLRASEVTAQTMLSGAATTKLTTRLEGAGLVHREGLPGDGRVVLLNLTDAGRALVEDRFPECVAHDGRLLEGLSAAERDTLANLLRRVAANAQDIADAR